MQPEMRDEFPVDGAGRERNLLASIHKFPIPDSKLIARLNPLNDLAISVNHKAKWDWIRSAAVWVFRQPAYGSFILRYLWRAATDLVIFV
jgi:hypothetical protein